MAEQQRLSFPKKRKAPVSVATQQAKHDTQNAEYARMVLADPSKFDVFDKIIAKGVAKRLNLEGDWDSL